MPAINGYAVMALTTVDGDELKWLIYVCFGVEEVGPLIVRV
jgi:hypothetical protein